MSYKEESHPLKLEDDMTSPINIEHELICNDENVVKNILYQCSIHFKFNDYIQKSDYDFLTTFSHQTHDIDDLNTAHDIYVSLRNFIDSNPFCAIVVDSWNTINNIVIPTRLITLPIDHESVNSLFDPRIILNLKNKHITVITFVGISQSANISLNRLIYFNSLTRNVNLVNIPLNQCFTQKQINYCQDNLPISLPITQSSHSIDNKINTSSIPVNNPSNVSMSVNDPSYNVTSMISNYPKLNYPGHFNSQQHYTSYSNHPFYHLSQSQSVPYINSPYQNNTPINKSLPSLPHNNYNQTSQFNNDISNIPYNYSNDTKSHLIRTNTSFYNNNYGTTTQQNNANFKHQCNKNRNTFKRGICNCNIL